jgi:transposase
MENEVCERCKPLFEQLIARFEEQQKEIDALKRRLAAYENAHTPPSKRYKRRLPPSTGKLGAPEGHPGTTRAEPDPTMTIEPTKEQCDHCHAPLGTPFRVERRIIEEIPKPQPIEVTEYRTGHYRCNNCGKVSVADGALQEGRFGPRTCAQVALLKFSDRLPNRLVVRALQRQYGLTIAPATVLDITRRMADAARPSYEHIIAKIRAASYVHIDESPLRVGGRTYYVWIFTTPTETLYVIRPTRGKSVPREILGNYQGVVVTDGYKIYPEFGSAQQRCWAHVLREMNHLAEKHPTAASLATEFHGIYTSLAELLKKRIDNRKTVYAEFVTRLQQWVDIALCYQELRKFARMIQQNLSRWFTCILYSEVPATNNHAERQLREIVVQRKIIGTLRNEKGTAIMETIMSLLMTWQQRGQNLLGNLLAILRS